MDPPYLWPEYRSTLARAPHRQPVLVVPGRTELTGPVFGEAGLRPTDADLTAHGTAEPIGERIVVHGRVAEATGRPVAGALIELWQANAAGRYAHSGDQHAAPLDPNFVGQGRVLSDAEGRYRFVTVKPGAYPWRNHENAWRPAHIHFSVFGRAFTQRLVTQLYFPGDPLHALDPILGSIRDPAARDRLVAAYDHEATVPQWALGYRFDLVLGGATATPWKAP